jgi:hypothetical protein
VMAYDGPGYRCLLSIFNLLSGEYLDSSLCVKRVPGPVLRGNLWDPSEVAVKGGAQVLHAKRSAGRKHPDSWGCKYDRAIELHLPVPLIIGRFLEVYCALFILIDKKKIFKKKSIPHRLNVRVDY